MLTPPKSLIYHLWEREYRPTFAKDHADNRDASCLEKIRAEILEDTDFIDKFLSQTGVDLLHSKVINEKATNGDLDPTFL